MHTPRPFPDRAAGRRPATDRSGWSGVPVAARRLARSMRGAWSRPGSERVARAGFVDDVSMRHRLASPLLRRVLLVNALPLALLVATLLYLGQYQNGLLIGEVGSLREQARIYAGALGQSAVRVPEGHRKGAVLVADLARPLLRRLTEPTPFSVARLYAPDGQLISDSNPDSVDGAPPVKDRTRAAPPSGLLDWLDWFYDGLLSLVPPSADGVHVVKLTHAGESEGLQWSPDVRAHLNRAAPGSTGAKPATGLAAGTPDIPPYIRRTRDNRLLVTVAVPVQHDGRTVGIILLTRAAGEVDRSLSAVRRSILDLFVIALVLTVALSWYFARTIARPILRLAQAALTMREGEGRTGAVPPELLSRSDEIGALGRALEQSARALWARMDATERFAADVSHEIKNPLSSISSAIETIRRVDNPVQQKRLFAIIAEDVARLDRLISDISSASRVDAELSRAAIAPVAVLPMMAALAEIHEATRSEQSATVRVEGPGGSGREADALVVLGVEDRLVQVLRNLIGNALSFSPPGGSIVLSARAVGQMVDISVSDDGPGIPQAKLEHIFERFYSERPPDERFGQHSGLGLSICRQIVEALKGRLSAQNRIGPDGRVAGAVFTVSLPRARPIAIAA